MTEPVDLGALEETARSMDEEIKNGPAGWVHWSDPKSLRAAITELRELRAWKERLGDPATWFPKIIMSHDPYHGERPDYSQLRDDSQGLQIACRALLERAKETP